MLAYEGGKKPSCAKLSRFLRPRERVFAKPFEIKGLGCILDFRKYLL